MKNRLKRVILSAAKNLWQPPGRDREREILRGAQNDMPEALFHGLLLLLVTVVPFPTSLVAQYLSTQAAALACAVYAGVFVVINLAYNLLWWTAVRERRLLHPAVTDRQVKRLTHHIRLGLPVYGLSTPLAFWNPYVSLGLCSCLWIFWAFTFYEGSPSPRRLTTE